MVVVSLDHGERADGRQDMGGADGEVRDEGTFVATNECRGLVDACGWSVVLPRDIIEQARHQCTAQTMAQ